MGITITHQRIAPNLRVTQGCHINGDVPRNLQGLDRDVGRDKAEEC